MAPRLTPRTAEQKPTSIFIGNFIFRLIHINERKLSYDNWGKYNKKKKSCQSLIITWRNIVLHIRCIFVACIYANDSGLVTQCAWCSPRWLHEYFLYFSCFHSNIGYQYTFRLANTHRPEWFHLCISILLNMNEVSFFDFSQWYYFHL